MFCSPCPPRCNRGRDELERGSLKRPSDGLPPHLGPDAFCLVVVPGHCIHKERPLIAKEVSFPIDTSVMNYARVTDRSPCNQDGDAAQRVVNHFPAVQRADGIGFGLPIDFHADDQFIIIVRGLIRGGKFRVINRADGVSGQ